MYIINILCVNNNIYYYEYKLYITLQDGHTLKSRETLMKEHTARWNAIRKKWHHQAHKNELRFIESANILSTIFKKLV